MNNVLMGCWYYFQKVYVKLIKGWHSLLAFTKVVLMAFWYYSQKAYCKILISWRYLTTFFIVVVSFAFFDRTIDWNFPINISVFLGNPKVFIFALLLCWVLYLLINLISVKLFSSFIDWVICSIGVGLTVYYYIAYFSGYKTNYSSAAVFFLLGASTTYFALRIAIKKVNVIYTDQSRKHFYREKGTFFRTDKPIQSASEDGLGRKRFCKRLANFVMAYSPADSFCIGLIGEWGSGKIVNY